LSFESNEIQSVPPLGIAEWVKSATIEKAPDADSALSIHLASLDLAIGESPNRHGLIFNLK
jgi:hypothetical protein